MKYILIIMLFFTQGFASINQINSFEADFTQNVTDEKQKVLSYSGHVIASKPQKALWRYTTPVQKEIYINAFNVTIIEPEIEQVIIRKLESSFDLFNIIKNAKEIAKNKYKAVYQDSEFIISIQNNMIKNISYVDEFENNVTIEFTNQVQNKTIDPTLFFPRIPVDFDIIRD